MTNSVSDSVSDDWFSIWFGHRWPIQYFFSYYLRGPGQKRPLEKYNEIFLILPPWPWPKKILRRNDSVFDSVGHHWFIFWLLIQRFIRFCFWTLRCFWRRSAVVFCLCLLSLFDLCRRWDSCRAGREKKRTGSTRQAQAHNAHSIKNNSCKWREKVFTFFL